MIFIKWRRNTKLKCWKIRFGGDVVLCCDGELELKDNGVGTVYWSSDTKGGKKGNELSGVSAPEGEFFLAPYANNPLIMAVCAWFSWGFLGYWTMGQKKKAIAAPVYTAAFYLIFLGWIWWLLAVVDTYLCSKKLQEEGSLEPNHCEVPVIGNLPLWK
eukprot:CAMPEP_0117451440 /NCGR_PEP_ID=MMETSP0759-20121206/9006_1 /TAXON_ID=63605 /ORGANISM="Percolomonas cosmopolitus, Strain WS" /LENGTH=157 /DNA_ID=CAMNT_0005244035 /DNA_START=661 /DNA_END=1134 /DNA_ORIENTATION=+